MKKGLFYYMLIACLCACQKKAEFFIERNGGL